ncbi:putative reverse transcriptase domain-containing protein [Tanacetum coccineum]
MAISVISVSSDPFIEITSSTQRSPIIPRRRVMILAPRQPIPLGRPYRYHLNGPVHIMTARKRVGPLPAQQLAMRYPVDHSSSDSSSKASSNFHSHASSDSSSRHSLPDHSFPDLSSTFARPSRKRQQDIDPEIQAEIDECFAYADALRDRGIDARVVVEVVDREESEMGTRGPVEVKVERVMHPVIEGVQREQGHKIVGVESAVTSLTKRVAELERDNRRLRDTASVKSQRVDRLQRSMSHMKMPNTRSGASMTHEDVEKLVTRRVAEEMEAREAARTFEPLNENGDEQEGENGGNRGNGNGGNGGNKGNGNGGNGENGNHGMNYGGFMLVARECTFQDFLKCKTHNFSRTEGVDSALTWWNSHKRTISVDDAYAMKWAGLMKFMTEVYCPRNEIQKMETELMVPDEEDRVERFIGGLPDNIQGNGYAARSTENKRRMESNLRDNRGQQPPFKRQKVSGQNMARAYAAGNNEKRGSTAVVPNTQRDPLGNQQGVICYECGRPGHVKRECPKYVQELSTKIVDDVRNVNEKLAEYTNTQSRNFPNSSYDDDDDEESSIPLKDIIMFELPPCVAIIPDSPKTDSLIMEDEHLSTIPETKSDEFIKSSVENLVPTPCESEDASNGQCDLPVYDDFPKSHLEDVPMENFKIFSNPLFDLDEEIIATEIDSLLDEFAGELTLIKSIPSGMDDDNLDPEGEIHPVERLLYRNSSPRPMEDSNSDVSDAITESFSPSPIPVEDSDSLMEEIDLFLTPDDSMPPGIETDDYDSEGDILFFEELLTDDSLLLPEHESFHFESDYDPSSPRPPAKPPDDDEIKPDTGLLTTKVVGEISEHYVLMPRLLPTQPTLCPVIQTLLPFSSENVDKVLLLSHRGFKALQLSSKSPMLIHRDNTPNLGVRHLHFYPP